MLSQLGTWMAERVLMTKQKYFDVLVSRLVVLRDNPKEFLERLDGGAILRGLAKNGQKNVAKMRSLEKDDPAAEDSEHTSNVLEITKIVFEL